MGMIEHIFARSGDDISYKYQYSNAGLNLLKINDIGTTNKISNSFVL